MSYSTPLIFPTYADATVGSEGCVAKGSLTSASDLAGATLSGTTSVVTYSENGILLNNGTNAAYLDFSGASWVDDIKNGFLCYMEIEKGFFDVDYGIATYSPAIFTVQQTAGSERRIIHRPVAGQNAFRCQMNGSNEDFYFSNEHVKKGHCKVWIELGFGWYRVYKDYNLWCQGAWDTADTTTAELFIPGDPNATNAAPEFRVRNIALWTRQMTTITGRKTIALFGDSRTELSFPTATVNSLQDSLACIPDGKTGATFDGGSVNYDSGWSMRIMAKLNEFGHGWSGTHLQMWAEGGAGLIKTSSTGLTMDDRVTTATSGLYPLPDVAVFYIGTNDLGNAATVPTTDFTDGTYKTAFETAIARLPSSCYVIVVLPMYRTDEDGTNVTTVRQQAMIDCISSVTGVDEFVDWFTASGGLSVDSTLLQADQVHESRKGNVKLSDLLYPAIYRGLIT